MKYVKTINPVIVDPRKGSSEILYFRTTRSLFDELASFKDQQGMVRYQIDVMVMRDGVLVSAENEFPWVTPIMAEYKLTTWKTLFGEMTYNGIESAKGVLMKQQISYNSVDYWGLVESDLEVIDL